MDHTIALIKKSHEGDKKAKEQIVEENVGLVWCVVKRFYGRGVDPEDLFQIGSIGLLKAIDKFELSYDVKFSTYAVPMIVGEIKRFLRDDGMLKVSRSLKVISVKAYRAVQSLEKELGREPTTSEIAKAIEVSEEELVMAMESGIQVESLQQIVYHGDHSDISLIDRVEEGENRSEKVIDRMFLAEILSNLNKDDRELLYKRYFQEKTQSAIAKEMGISQVQVSRLEKRILKKIREKYL
ncbi:MAG: SigB/SigF/SigG family RNA polymerase sigma factor [Schaedlerella sp.]|nr:SigB/SigF/SigG family RNA polymerase sigma factor [Schaedlerella sp.]